MCETTKTINRYPHTQRQLLEVRVLFARLLRDLTLTPEEIRELAERNA